MVTDVVAVHTTDSMQVASRLMMERRIHRVIVVEEDGDGVRPIGVVSVTDVVRDIASESGE
jgi:CBS domain-containing protein